MELCYDTEISFLAPDSNSARNFPEYTDLGLKLICFLLTSTKLHPCSSV